MRPTPNVHEMLHPTKYTYLHFRLRHASWRGQPGGARRLVSPFPRFRRRYSIRMDALLRCDHLRLTSRLNSAFLKLYQFPVWDVLVHVLNLLYCLSWFDTAATFEKKHSR